MATAAIAADSLDGLGAALVGHVSTRSLLWSWFYGVNLACQGPCGAGCGLDQYLPGHALVIARIPLHPVAAQVDKLVSHAKDGAPVVEQVLGNKLDGLVGNGTHSSSKLPPKVASLLWDGGAPSRAEGKEPYGTVCNAR